MDPSAGGAVVYAPADGSVDKVLGLDRWVYSRVAAMKMFGMSNSKYGYQPETGSQETKSSAGLRSSISTAI